MRLSLLICCLLGMLNVPLRANDAPMEVYLLIGQSNMAGRGKLEGQEPTPRVWMFTEWSQWRPAVNPIRVDKPKAAGVGPGIAFAQALQKVRPTAEIGLVNRAFGGTRIREWKKGQPLYKEAVASVKAACAANGGQLRGILWHQGESDYRGISSEDYETALQELLGDLRKDLEAEGLPVVMGELGEFIEVREQAPSVVNDALHRVAQKDPTVVVVSAAELKDRGDKLHFDTASQQIFGERYAEAMAKLQQEIAEKKSK